MVLRGMRTITDLAGVLVPGGDVEGMVTVGMVLTGVMVMMIMVFRV